MRPMQIVIPGGLPPPPYAAELAKYLPEHAPSLVDILGHTRTRMEDFDPIAAGCTTFEAWQLAQAGFPGEPDMPLGAGLGPLLARSPAGGPAPVWLADFVHLALGTDQASLIPAESLAPSLKEARALLEAIEPALTEAGFTARLIDALRLQITLPPGLAPLTASPNTVAGQSLQAWWATDPGSRPWRRALNEIQMIWHDHPVNEARQNCGQLPINALWLYGGARPWTPAPTPRAGDTPAVLTGLLEPARAGDWAAWLDALSALEASTFKPLLNGRSGELKTLTLTLMGDKRVAHASWSRASVWLRWIPKTTTNWKHWWSLPA